MLHDTQSSIKPLSWFGVFIYFFVLLQTRYGLEIINSYRSGVHAVCSHFSRCCQETKNEFRGRKNTNSQKPFHLPSG